MNRRIYLSVVCLLLSFIANAQQDPTILRGRVIDESRKPIVFASVWLEELELAAWTDTAGYFVFRANLEKATPLSLRISFVGKKTINRKVTPATFVNGQVFQMQDLSLTLDDVEVSARRLQASSNSSIIFGREAIEQLQAFSLAEILNQLPGKTATPPMLQNPQQITLRTQADGNYALANSLGTAIYIDGIRQSNDANMQNRSLSARGMSGSVLGSRSDGAFDVPFGGLDLRDIPVDNIESVEVVTGVASAQYGELTDGAIIINRQAGKTPYQLNTRINGGSTDVSLSKGFKLNNRLGALNISLGYLRSNKDPRDKIKSFDRVSLGMMWTTYLFKGVKNTFSFDYNTRLDDVKQDPDDDTEKMTYAKGRNLSITNRISIDVKSPFLRNISLNAGFSTGYQDTYSQWLLNGMPKGLADKDTTGIYEGRFIPGNYLAEERIIGKPVTFDGNLKMTASYRTGSIVHGLNYGMSMSVSANNGEGIVLQPDKPRWVGTGNQNVRPYNFDKLVPALVSYGFYAQDNFTMKVAGKRLVTGIGLRYDLQNGWGSIQPRINTRYILDKHWEVTLAYGVASKSPTLAHRYPAPAWLDIPLLSVYTGYENSSLFLVYTHKQETDNSRLKPSKSSQVELGVKYNNRFLNSSLFLYSKRNMNGFNSYSEFLPLTLPEYGYNYTPGQKPTYFPTGNYILYADVKRFVVTNGLRTENYGAEWILSTRKIPEINTSFTLSTAFSLSKYYNSNDRRMYMMDTAKIPKTGKALFGVYSREERQNWSLVSRISSDTHIPALGFVVSLAADIFWANERKVLGRGYRPTGYLDRMFRYHEIISFDPQNPDYGYLPPDPDAKEVNEDGVIITESMNSGQPLIYAIMSMRIAKEIKKKIRISISAYNVLNKRPSKFNEKTQKTDIYGSPLSVTAGISLKF
ncbi:TonB-dependent receptor [Chitinophaga sp. Mgbs1]|uniref:TonB-dependent receptor n=1 Tax=Chitinophaga solisilvae TaxID=1233460 RepID=A0A3S1B4I6_9BACT|nr:TonB-dependent receptor [Chitinophaga solisilvae]